MYLSQVFTVMVGKSPRVWERFDTCLPILQNVLTPSCLELPSKKPHQTHTWKMAAKCLE